jgi:hypothetical protein
MSVTETTRPWKGYEKISFRIAFIFFIIIAIPNNPGWYSELFHLNWFRLNYRDLYDIARFESGISFSRTFLGSTLIGYASWLWTLVLAIVGAAIWTIIVRARKTERQEYTTLYYWLRVVVRYRAGIGIIGFGFTKLFPVQMPYPGLGLLNTNFGDLTAQKVFWLSVGIVPWYQVFAGVVESAAGALLFFRRTTTIGAILLLGALGDIVYVNLAYDGGVHVYASYFVLLAAFLLAKDVPRLYRLLIQERLTIPQDFYPVLRARWQQYGRIALKAGTIFIFIFLLFYLQYVNFRYDPYKQPAVAGVHQLRGNYTVTEFRINDKVIPFDPLDSIRWQDATFENWSSLSFSVNRPLPLDLSNGGGAPQRDIDRTFEISGVAGGRRVFHYYADTVDKVLYLEDKYKAPDFFRNRGVVADGGGGQGNNPGSGGRGGKRRRNGAGQGNAGQGDGGRGDGGQGDAGRGDAGRGGEGDGGQANSGVLANNNVPAGGNPQDSSGRTARRGRGGNWITPEAWAHIGNEADKIDPRAGSDLRDREYAQAPKRERRNRMILHYSTVDDGSRIILTGIDDHKDSVYIVLDRNKTPYALSESSLQAGKY